MSPGEQATGAVLEKQMSGQDTLVKGGTGGGLAQMKLAYCAQGKV